MKHVCLFLAAVLVNFTALGSFVPVSVASGRWQVSAIPEDTAGRVVVPSAVGGQSVLSLGDFAFFGCRAVTEIDLPASATERYGESAFENCTALTAIRLPSGLTALSTSLFAGCAHLREVILPQGLLSVGPLAFRGCTALRQIDLPDSVVRLHDAAFFGCTLLERVTLPAALEHPGSSLFYGCSGLISVTFRAGTKSLSRAMFGKCDALETLVFEGPVPQLRDGDTGDFIDWSDVLEDMHDSVRSRLTIVYPAVYAAEWSAAVKRIGCRGQVVETMPDVAIELEDANLLLAPDEQRQLVQSVARLTGRLPVKIAVCGSAVAVRVSLAFGMLPEVLPAVRVADAVADGVVAVRFSAPTLQVTALSPEAGTMMVRALPGEGCTLPDDARMRAGVLKVYAADSADMLADGRGWHLMLNDEMSERAGECILFPQLPRGTPCFLRVTAEP